MGIHPFLSIREIHKSRLLHVTIASSFHHNRWNYTECNIRVGSRSVRTTYNTTAIHHDSLHVALKYGG